MPSTLEQIMVKMGFDTSETSKVTDAMNQVNQETRKAGEGMELFNFHSREGHQVIHEIGREAPVVGGLLKAAFNPEAIGIMALGAAFTWVMGQIEKLEEKVKELSQGLREMWYQEQEAAAKAKEAVTDYHQKVAEIVENTKSKVEEENSAYERQVELIKKVYEGHAKVTQAINEAADEDLKRKREAEDKNSKHHEEKELSGARTEAQKQAIKQRYEMQRDFTDKQREYQDAVTKNQREKQAEDDIRTAEQASKKIAESRAKQLTTEVSDAAKKANRDADEIAKHASARNLFMSSSEKNLEDLKKQMAENDANLERHKSGVAHSIAVKIGAALDTATLGGTGILATDAKTEENLQKKKVELESQFKNLTEERARIQSEIAKDSEKEAKNKDDLQKKQDALTKAQAEQAKLQQEISINEQNRAQLDRVRAAELQRLRNDTIGRDTSLDFDSTLQLALRGEAGATNDATRQYWQKIIDARMSVDRRLHPGLPDDPVKKAQTDTDKELNKQQTDYLKRIADAITGDDNK